MNLKKCPEHSGSTYTQLDPKSIENKLVERLIRCIDCDRLLGTDFIKIPFSIPVKAIPERRKLER